MVIEARKWKDIFQFATDNLPAVALGVVVATAVTISLYEYIVLPGKDNQIEYLSSQIPNPSQQSNLLNSTSSNCQNQPVSAVFIDGYGMYAGYRGEDQTDKSSNAHYLVSVVKGDNILSQKVYAKDAILAQNGKFDVSKVVNLNPDVIVIHRSTFEETTNAEDRLVELLKGFRGIVAPIIVFSRTPNTDAIYAQKLAHLAALDHIVHPYQFRPGNPFKDHNNVLIFLNFVETIGRAKVCAWNA